MTRSWNCWENFESKEAKWGILALLETLFGRSWSCLEYFENKEAKWCILELFEKVYWKLELLRKFESNAFCKLNGAFGHFSKNVVDDFRGNYWMSKYVHHWKNLIRLYDTTQSCGHFVFYYFKHFSITIYIFCALYFICNLQHISKTRLQTV